MRRRKLVKKKNYYFTIGGGNDENQTDIIITFLSIYCLTREGVRNTTRERCLILSTDNIIHVF